MNVDTTKTSPLQPVGAWEGHRILVVEDDSALCALLSDLLSDRGFEVSCASTDRAAYEVLRHDGDLLAALVVDVNLGRGTTGFDVARFARSINATVPVIYITGDAPRSVAKFGVEGGVLVAKPFDQRRFYEVIDALLGGTGPV